MPTKTNVTFEVSDVSPACSALAVEPCKNAIERLFQCLNPASDAGRGLPCRAAVESCSHLAGRLVANVTCHPLVGAVHRAFAGHRPLCLSPEIIWLTVAQGFANHINANGERLRSRFVRHQGKATLSVHRDDFIKGTPENPWAEVFAEISSQIREHIGPETHDLLTPKFSTTSATEQAAFQVVLMDMMRTYFDYDVTTLCGIPTITLLGSTDDWCALHDHVAGLKKFELDWWIEPLLVVLKHFSAAVEGRVDRWFWQSIYKLNGGSGGPYVSGWILALFPYLTGRDRLPTKRNAWIDEFAAAPERLLGGPPDDERRLSMYATTASFPIGVSRLPFDWKYYSDVFPMEFLAGFVGIQQDPATLCLRPEIGWAVRDAVPDKFVSWDDLVARYGQPRLARCLSRMELQKAFAQNRLMNTAGQLITDAASLTWPRDYDAWRRNEVVVAFPNPVSKDLYVGNADAVSVRTTILRERTPARHHEMQLNDQLLAAAAQGDAASVEQRIRDGAVIACRRPVMNLCLWQPQRISENALEIAARAGHDEVVRILIEHGAILENPYGTFAWMCAATNQHWPTSERLIRAGVKVAIAHWQRRFLKADAPVRREFGLGGRIVELARDARRRRQENEIAMRPAEPKSGP